MGFFLRLQHSCQCSDSAQPAVERIRTLQCPPSVLLLLAAHAMPHSSPRSPGQRPIPPARGALDMLAHKGAWCCPGCCPGFSPSRRGFGESDFVMKTPSTTPFACFRDRKLVPVVTSGSWAESPSVEAWGMGEGRKIDVAHGPSWLWCWSSACCRKCRADTVCTPPTVPCLAAVEHTMD